MKIRSVTCFINVGDPPTQVERIRHAGQMASEARVALRAAGYEVQTIRLATQPLTYLAADPLQQASDLWATCAEAGFEYLSLGPVLADDPPADLSRLEIIPNLLRVADAVFAGILVVSARGGPNLAAIRHTAGIVREIAHTTDQGFGNLRLALLANVGPHAPFFPAAYHDGGPPALAVAVEAADLAVAAFSEDGSLVACQNRLVEAVELAAAQISSQIRPLAARHGYRFVGIDFSLAPFPEVERSIGTAVERLGVDRFGAPGTLFAISLLTDCLRQADYPRCGFNGVMLPVLEDATLAARSQERLFTVNDLLLYSAVCGTGLDTVPLPGDISEDELAGILLDVATLAMRLDKPLTARLMPIPGARAGDRTEFDFAYFANGQVLDARGLGSQGLFVRDHRATIVELDR
jgi:uncharacterized protein (UPF0210 family)